MHFGVNNSLPMFNGLMDIIFCKDNSFKGLFFGDIVVYLKTLNEHKEILAKVFKELKAHKIHFN